MNGTARASSMGMPSASADAPGCPTADADAPANRAADESVAVNAVEDWESVDMLPDATADALRVTRAAESAAENAAAAGNDAHLPAGVTTADRNQGPMTRCRAPEAGAAAAAAPQTLEEAVNEELNALESSESEDSDVEALDGRQLLLPRSTRVKKAPTDGFI